VCVKTRQPLQHTCRLQHHPPPSPRYLSLNMPSAPELATTRTSHSSLSRALACSRVLSRALACSRVLSRALACSRVLSRALACSRLLSLALACSRVLSLALACSRLLSLSSCSQRREGEGTSRIAKRPTVERARKKDIWCAICKPLAISKSSRRNRKPLIRFVCAALSFSFGVLVSLSLGAGVFGVGCFLSPASAAAPAVFGLGTMPLLVLLPSPHTWCPLFLV